MSETFPKPGARIKHILKSVGLSQTRLAEAVGVDSARMSKMLNLKEPVPVEYFHPILHELGQPHGELDYLYSLHDIQEWRKRITALSRDPALRPFQASDADVAGYLIDLAAKLARADEDSVESITRERTYGQHLLAAHAALAATVEALGGTENMLFNPANVRRHLRYPTNYYMAALMNLSDDAIPGGTALGERIQQLVDDVVDIELGSQFLQVLSRQHGHHMNARYGRPGRDSEQPASLLRSDDVHNRRMYLIGRAMRDGATDRDWANLFDAMDKPDFQEAVLAFDTSHYDDAPIQRDGWVPYHAVVRRTALRYMIGFAASDPNLRAFAAKRMKVLIQHSSPKSLRDPDLLRGLGVLTDRDVALDGDAAEAINLLRKLQGE